MQIVVEDAGTLDERPGLERSLATAVENKQFQVAAVIQAKLDKLAEADIHGCSHQCDVS